MCVCMHCGHKYIVIGFQWGKGCRLAHQASVSHARKNAHTHTVGQINIVIGNLAGQGLAPNLNQPLFSLSLHTRAHIHSYGENWGSAAGKRWIARSSTAPTSVVLAAVSRGAISRIERIAPSLAFFGGKPGFGSVSGRNRLSGAPAQENPLDVRVRGC